ncbi:MAG: RNA polymerase factor sigma-54 [Rickettsiaceae bacterium]|nr:RNA polymerase factor sigma-54 [Rickettsiaceae bacterium]
MPKQIQTTQQKQNLTMTTSMHQSIAVLQMSSIELAEYVRKELDKNPFIEDENIIEERQTSTVNERTRIQEDASSYNSKSNNDNAHYNFLANIATEKTLKEYIIEQINTSIYDQKEKLVAIYLLDSIQSSGYLNIELEEVAENLKCNIKMVKTVLKKLQSFDPAGIFARNLQECLQIQIDDKKLNTPGIQKMIDNLDLVAAGNLRKLSKLCKANLVELTDMIKTIKSLNPKPASGFLVEQTSYKIPDVILTTDGDGNIKLEINPESMPKLHVNQEYYLKIKDSTNNKEEKEFVRAEVESANTVIKSINQRANTILKVTKAIVEEQMQFFTNGVMYLKPMTLNDIAAITGFNESTVSRSTSNKYISAPSGIYELKYFFSSSLGNTRAIGSDVSSTKAKELIKQIIMSEGNNILSDDEISEELKKFNIRIARRTVAKYRESLGIPTSSERKKNKFFARNQ